MHSKKASSILTLRIVPKWQRVFIDLSHKIGNAVLTHLNDWLTVTMQVVFVHGRSETCEIHEGQVVYSNYLLWGTVETTSASFHFLQHLWQGLDIKASESPRCRLYQQCKHA